MAEPSAIEKLRQKPKDERTAVASSVAVFVVIILFLGWAIFFIRGIQKGTQTVNLDSGAQDSFNFDSVKQAQDALKNQYNTASQDMQDLQAVRQNAGQSQTATVQVAPTPDATAGNSSQFGLPPDQQQSQ